jgi:hypothetical protein
VGNAVSEGLDQRPADRRRSIRQRLTTAGFVLVFLALSVLAWMAMADAMSADTGM